MRTDFYRQLVCAINSRSPWLKVDNEKAFVIRPHRADDCDIDCAFPALVLRAIAREDGYRRGTKWEIPEQDLDAALARMRKKDSDFCRRLQEDNATLTMADIEQLIEVATHGIVKLRLSDVPNDRYCNNHLIPTI